ncbi:hypothetical protein SAY87_010400 [Trapa incisa]|uniref:ATP-sulfurylase PUA-like domain-containing protein n=1 Tax=Trapa incisa TaxID=236973 RepID=A0AAN7GH18_9MYRT|nr:hypothetical protein SAY87_010400 [Trapa incisa]
MAAISSLVYSPRQPIMTSSNVSNGTADRPPSRQELPNRLGRRHPVDLVVPESDVEAKAQEDESLRRVPLTRIDLEWVHVINDGWASPLKEFMLETEYLPSQGFMRDL